MAKVFLSAGHGGSDPGAVAYGLKEKEINLQILLACKAELERHGVAVVCSRVTDANDPVKEEVKEANLSGAEVAVSFHTNAGKGDGSETFYHSPSSPGKKLARLCEKYVKELGQNSRGAKATNSLYFLRKTTMPAALCECAFIDHDTDNNIIDTVAEQKKFGVAYAKAILEYLLIEYREPAKSQKRYRVQVGVFSSRQNAEKALKKAKTAGFPDSFIDEV
jgi:N-acetylmuramoyl-L-alanine amidase